MIQHGDRICGTWTYFATGQENASTVVARAISETKARRTQVCGRPGSETDTPCEEGWQQMDRPLELCAGKLSDMTGFGDACLADYEAVPAAEDELAALEAARG